MLTASCGTTLVAILAVGFGTESGTDFWKVHFGFVVAGHWKAENFVVQLHWFGCLKRYGLLKG